MRNRLVSLAATVILALAAASGGAATAKPLPLTHSHGKPNRLPPIDMSNAANCDFIAVNPGSQIGVPPPPYENLPNREGEDPHGAPRAATVEQQLVSHFFGGAIQSSDDCGGGPCFAGGFTGP